MRKALIAALSSATLLAAVPLAQAMPLAGIASSDSGAITLVAGGCGPGFHRGPMGGCRPNFGPRPFGPRPFFRGRACPPGSHLGPAGRACRPNF